MMDHIADRLINGISRVFKGERIVIEKTLAAFISGGHILIEDLPGTGKTTIARTMAKLVDSAVFKRIQFTPDLLPYDITGVEVWDDSRREFVFRAGPVFANIVLADEINRTTPKVQSALLESMSEAQVTVGNHSYQLPSPFLVIATQNPIEMEGTYPLPEAQKDRFMLLLKPGYPDRETEYSIIMNDPGRRTLPHLESVCTLEELSVLTHAVQDVHVDNRLMRCAVDIAVNLREHSHTILGVSTRGTLMLIDAMKGLAVMRHRDYVIDQDLVDLVVDAYAHRIRIRHSQVPANELVAEVASQEIRRIKHD